MPLTEPERAVVGECLTLMIRHGHEGSLQWADDPSAWYVYMAATDPHWDQAFEDAFVRAGCWTPPRAH
jgi:hypothetical protein